MLKKSLTIFVIVMLLFSSFSVYALIPYYAENTETETEVPFGLLEELEILHLDEYVTMDSEITKGLFLKWVIRMTGIKDDNIPTASKRIFLDVPLESEYASWVEYGYNREIVVGNGIGSLEVDNIVTTGDAAIMAVRAVGYDIEPSLLLRTQATVLDGLDPNQKLTSKTAMQILLNTLSLPTMMKEYEGNYINQKQTILKQLFHVDIFRGIVDDDAVININSGVSALRADQISIDGTVMKVKEGAGVGLAGHRVDAYVQSEQGVKKALFVHPVGNDIKILKREDVLSYSHGVIKFDDKKTLKVSDTAKNIWNFDRVYLKNGELALPTDGNLVVIDHNEDSYADCVFVFEPQFGTITGVNEKENVLYVSQDVNKVYKFNDNKAYEFYDYSGKQLKLSDLTEDMLVEIYASSDQSRFVMFAQKNVVEYTVSAIHQEGNKQIITTADGAKFEVSPHFDRLNEIQIQLGKSYQMSFDGAGRIATIKEVEDGTLNYGYLFSYRTEGAFESGISMAIYSVNDELVTASAKKKIRVKENNTDTMWTVDALLNKFNANFEPTLVRYALDKEGKVSKLEFPSADKFYAGFRCVGTSGNASDKDYNARMRVGSIYMLGGQILLDSKATKILIVPEDLSPNGEWKILDVATALKDGKYYPALKGYGVNPASMTADVIVMPESVLGYADAYNIAPGLISGFDESYDAKTQESFSSIRVYQDGAEVSLRLDENVKPQYTLKSGEVIDLAVGDVIRVVKDHNDRVISIKLLFDESSQKSYGADDSTIEQTERGYGYQQRTNYGTPYKIVGNAMYIIRDQESIPSSDIFRTDIGTIYEYDKTKREPIRVITGNDIETVSNNPGTTDKVFIQLSYSKSLITVVYK